MIWPYLSGPANFYYFSNNNNQASPAKLAHNISQIFKNDDRFTGNFGGNILDYIDSNDEAMRDYSVPYVLKTNFLTVFSRMKQRYFYREQVQPYTLSCEAAKVRILKTYCKATWKYRVRQYL